MSITFRQTTDSRGTNKGSALSGSEYDSNVLSIINNVGVDVRWFGAVADYDSITDSGTDNTMFFQNALNYCALNYIPLHIPATEKPFGISQSTNINLSSLDWVVINGDGIGKSKLKMLSDGVRGFSGTNTSLNLVMSNFTIEGRHNNTSTLGVDSDRPIGINECDTAIISNVEVLYSRQMSMAIRANNYIKVSFCNIQYSARDSINLTGSGDIIVGYNQIRNCKDDAIALHWNTTKGSIVDRSIICSNNYIEDSNGIVCLGAQHFDISNNVIKRPKGYGIRVGGSSGIEGFNNTLNGSVSNNKIFDTINLSVYGGGSVDVGIWVDSPNPTQGSLDAIPSQFDYTNNVFVLPDSYWYQNNSSNYTGSDNLHINNNIVAKTLPSVTDYSDWGFGLTYDDVGGFVDESFGSYTHMRTGSALRISNGASLRIKVSGNTFSGYGSGISFNSCSIINDVVIEQNKFFRIRNFAIDDDNNTQKDVRLYVYRNQFNLDPYLEQIIDGNRNSDGSWGNTFNASTVCYNSRMSGIVFKNNVLRNTRTSFSSSNLAEEFNNTYILELKANTGLSGHKGTGTVGSPQCSNYVYEDSDPTSATYLEPFEGINGRAFTAQPTSGYFIQGQIIWNSQPLATEAMGWIRLKNGNSHVDGVDWETLTIIP